MEGVGCEQVDKLKVGLSTVLIFAFLSEERLIEKNESVFESSSM